jgi:hypothetical protein
VNTWFVRIRFTEPSYALARGIPEHEYEWQWTGRADSGVDAAAKARAEFQWVFDLSRVGWVRRITSVDSSRLEAPEPPPANGPASPG